MRTHPGSDDSPVEPPRIKWWLRRLGLASLLGTGILLSAPTGIAYFGLLSPLASHFSGTETTTIEVRESSLGWFSPVVLRGAHYSSEGVVDFAADEIATSKTLVSLLMDYRQLGEVKILRPVIHAKVPERQEAATSEGSDKEVAANNPWIEPILGQVQVEDGVLILEDKSGKPIELKEIQGLLAVNLATNDVHLTGSAEVVDDKNPAKVDIDAEVKLDALNSSLVGMASKLKANSFPLASVNSILAATGQRTRLGGLLTCNAQLTYAADQQSIVVDGTGTINQFVVEATWLDPDRIALDKLELNLAATATASGVTVDGSHLVCELGSATGKGHLSWSTTRALTEKSLELTGVIDLPTLAKQLPHLLRVREGTNVSSGRLAVSIRPSVKDHKDVETSMEVSDLEGSRDGKEIRWTKPIAMTALGTDTVGQWQIKEIQGESDFLTVKGNLQPAGPTAAPGTPPSFDVTATSDLSRLQERIGQFLDFGDSHVSGRLTARIQTQPLEQRGMVIRGAAKGEMLDVRWNGATIALEKLINAQFQAKIPDTGAKQIESAMVVIKTDVDQLTARLQGPVVDYVAGPWGSWSVEANGDLAGQLQRAKPWSDSLAGYQIAGNGSLKALVTLDPNRYGIENVDVTAQNFQLISTGLRISEPTVTMQATRGYWIGATSNFGLTDMTIKASSAKGNLSSLQGTMQESGLELSAEANVIADLARLRNWTLSDPRDNDVAGAFKGKLALKGGNRRWVTEIQGTVHDAKYGSGPQPLIEEPQVELAAKGTFDVTKDLATIDRLRITMVGLAMSAEGELAETSGRQVVQLRGEMTYDLAELKPRIRGLLGSQIDLVGKETRPFQIAGPIGKPAGDSLELVVGQPSNAKGTGNLTGVTGQFGFGWQTANFYGFAAGGANIQAKLADSWLVTKPIEFPLNGGAIKLQPALFFATGSTYFVHPAGVLATNVNVTREMCDGALQYIAPVLAKSVDVKGSMTLELNEAQIPLGHFEQAALSGRLSLREVVASGSPLIQELLVFSEGGPVVELARDSVVPFRIAGGRVYHENLQIRLPGATITTSGSVGFDHTLAMVVELPIPKKWLRSQELAEALKDQTIKIPITGTLERPKLDQQALQREIARTVERSAGQRIEKEINKEVDKQLNNLFNRIR